MAHSDRGGSHQGEDTKTHHHAHFQDHRDQDDLNAHDSQILVDYVTHDKINVRLGFLQIHHVYQVCFSIEDRLSEDVRFDPLQTLNAKIESANPSEDGRGHDLVLTFSAAKEKIMQESVTLHSQTDASQSVTLVLHARVLGKGKGTPSLKKGVHCVRVDCDEESDASDWPGF
ncbi:UPF0687 protein C20orf27 homolog [Aplysia californica]|uniref:Adipose-secreted signaling protein n=1 Tax=Aplysia californica TaxID=6500 RepID=A0ABM1A888_APLCA|nr:UPF0687 protein C20orf27 homolog [Aplysia californica]